MKYENETLNNKRGYLREDFQLFHLVDQKDMQFEFHYHDFNKIIILISGNVTYLIEGTAYKLKPWDIILVNSNEIHKVVVNSDEVYERIIMWVNSDFLNKHNVNNSDLLTCFQLAEAQKNNLLRSNLEVQNTIKHILNGIEEAYKSQEFGSDILKNALFLQLVVYINRLFLSKDNNKNLEDIDYDENISKILDYINKNLREDLAIDSIAEMFYMSKYYLMHKFKKQTGYTIHNYVMQKRLIMANSLVKEGRTITEVCMECGFEDYSNFMRAFKKMFGMAPKKYYKGIRGREL